MFNRVHKDNVQRSAEVKKNPANEALWFFPCKSPKERTTRKAHTQGKSLSVQLTASCRLNAHLNLKWHPFAQLTMSSPPVYLSVFFQQASMGFPAAQW